MQNKLLLQNLGGQVQDIQIDICDTYRHFARTTIRHLVTLSKLFSKLLVNRKIVRLDKPMIYMEGHRSVCLIFWAITEI